MGGPELRPLVTASCNARSGQRWDSEVVAMQVLLVDDNQMCAAAVQHLLERQGVRVVGVACKSAEAVELVTVLRPDVVLIDLMLGNECGLDLAELLARGDSGDTPPMILISARSAADVADLIATSPVAGFLQKADLSADAIRELIGAGSAAARNP
jgi:DNA-binding NarL/FixJ family response regulator